MACSSFAVLSVLLLFLAVTAGATHMHQAFGAVHVRGREESAGIAAGAKVALAPTETKDGAATQGEEGGKGREREEGKEGGGKGKSCVTNEECHKKKVLCVKKCSLAAHGKCVARCAKACVPLC